MAAPKKTPAKPTPNGVVKRDAATAAVAELRDEPVTGVFRGIELTLPPKLPATFALDMAAVQAAESNGNLGPIYTLLVGSLGAEQWQRIRDRIAADGDAMDALGDILEELLEAITAPYGMGPGESPASETS